MIEMDKDMHSLGILIAKRELAFLILEKKKKTVLLTISNNGNKTPNLLFAKQTQVII